MAGVILDVRNLSVSYDTPRGPLKALRNISMQVPEKRSLAL